jgi:hypothetical protein
MMVIVALIANLTWPKKAGRGPKSAGDPSAYVTYSPLRGISFDFD